MRKLTATLVNIRCQDGGIAVQEAALTGSELVQNLPSCPESLPVPFCSHEVQSWSVVNTNPKRTFADCVAALKVADFLQDQSTASAAAEYANSLLFDGTGLDSHLEQGMLEPTPEVAGQDVATLLSLDTPLAEAILRAAVVGPRKTRAECHCLSELLSDLLTVLAGELPRGVCVAWNIRPFVFPPSLLQQCTGSSSLADWLCVLPTSCLHLAVSAAVDPQTSAFSFARQLGMKDDVFNESLPAIASALQQLPVALHTITASGIHDGRALARAITTLKNLRCLELTQCLQPAVPETLTALTKLNIDCSNTLFECDISKFTTLKDLRLGHILVMSNNPDAMRGTPHLAKLTALTALEFHSPVVAQTALESLRLLSRLTLWNKDVSIKSSIDLSGMTALSTNLTFLALGFSWGQPAIVANFLSMLPQLVEFENTGKLGVSGIHVSLLQTTSHALPKVAAALSQMHQLRRLHVLRSFSAFEVAEAMHEVFNVLPHTLTSLTLCGGTLTSTLSQDLGLLTNLESLSLRLSHGMHAQVARMFQNFQCLRHLDLWGCHLGRELADVITAVLAVLPCCMLDLNIRHNRFPAHAFAPLAGLTMLTRLLMGPGDGDIDDDVAQGLLRCLPQLKALKELLLCYNGMVLSSETYAALQCCLEVVPHVDISTVVYRTIRS